MANDDLRDIRRGWGRRLLATGRIGASAARLATRRLFGREGAADGEIGQALAAELDQLKGMAMKVGQILSYFEGVLPDDTHAALRGLQTGQRPVQLETMAAVVHDAFGEPIDALFESFDPSPIASASIGQVYRARYEGHPVAVKVQYPAIRDTIKGDFSRLDAVARIASLATAVDGAAIVEELRARFVEECDYLREATHQRAFRAALADDPVLRVPAPVLARTRRAVLTSQWADGRQFYEFAARSGPAARSAAALALVGLAARSFFAWGTINADPHPGNYLFEDSGVIALLDFGCVRRFEPAFVDAERRLALVVLDERRAAFRDAAIATGMIPDPDRFDFDMHWATLRHQYAPYAAPRFRFTFDHLEQGARFSRPSNPNLRRLAIPPPWIWLQRLFFGLSAVLARLDAEGPFAEAFRTALDTPLSPLPIAGIDASVGGQQ